jgi:DNA polymerase-3 subunit epsilon
MELILDRPIVFFDIESTGTQVAADRIVEICVLKINPDGTEEVKTRRINPTIPIPKETSLIHGIYDEDIKDEPVFKAVAKSLADFIGDADLAGYNSNKFDVPMLLEEFYRAGIDFPMENRRLVDVQNIFHQMEQRTLVAAVRF